MSNELQNGINKAITELIMCNDEQNVIGVIAIYIDKDMNIRKNSAFPDNQLPALIMGLEIAKAELVQLAMNGTKQLVRTKQ